jgi:hypothetical protein
MPSVRALLAGSLRDENARKMCWPHKKCRDYLAAIGVRRERYRRAQRLPLSGAADAARIAFSALPPERCRFVR